MMLDLIFVVGLAIALFVGYRAGFARALVGFAGVFISAFGGYLLYPSVSALLMKTPLYGMIYGLVMPGVKGYVSQNLNLGDLFSRYQVNTTELLAAKISEGITLVIFHIISIILIILAIKLLVHILKKSTKFINRIPVLGKINQLAGLLFSGASYITVCFLIVAVMFLPPANSSELSRNMSQQIDQSIIVKPVMKCNFFVDYQSMK